VDWPGANPRTVLGQGQSLGPVLRLTPEWVSYQREAAISPE
jgi:hypothetical protein